MSENFNPSSNSDLEPVPEAARRIAYVPESVIKHVGAEPDWYVGELGISQAHEIGTLPISNDVSARLRIAPKTVVSRGGKPDAALLAIAEASIGQTK